MPECKLKQYSSSKVKTRNNNNNKAKDGVNKKSKIKTTIEIKNIKDYSDDSSLIMTVKNKTLNDSNWKDSFDRLLDTRSPLRKKNIIKKDIRLSYNLDSSVNTSNEKSFQDSKNITKSISEKNIGNNNKEQSNSSSILNQTPIYKRKSFLDTFNKLMNKRTRGSKKVKKKSTISSTPLVNAATKNGKRKTKKLNKKSAAEMDDMFLLPTISPIRNEPSPLVFNKSLLKSFTASEKKRVWKDLFGMNWSENNENYINDNCNNKFLSNEQSNLVPLSPVQNESNPGVSRNLFSVSQNFEILDNSNVDSTKHKANVSKNQLFKDIQNIFQYAKDHSVQSLDNSKNVSLSYQQVQSILDESLSNIEKSLSQFDANKSNKQLPPSPHENDELKPSDVEKLNQTLQTIEDTYNSVLEDGELMTPEISDKFHNIDKNLDNLILNNSKQLNLTKTTEENCIQNTSNDLINPDTNNLFEEQKDNTTKNVDVDIDVHNNLDNQKNIFENNEFVNKLIFLKNCLAIGGGKEAKRSLPVIIKDNVNNLVRSNSLNALSKTNTRHTLDSSNLNLKNRNNKILIRESTLQNVKNDRRNSLDSNNRIVNGNFSFIQNSIESTSFSQNFNYQLNNSTETTRTQSSFKFLQNFSNITTKINSTLDALNKTNNKEISSTKRDSLPNFNSKNVTIAVSNEKKSRTKYSLRKYNSENFKIISKKHKTHLPLVQKFVPLRKSLLDINFKTSETSLDSKKSDDNSESVKNPNLTSRKTKNDITKETHAKLSTGNQAEIINKKRSMKTSMTKKDSINIKIDGLIKPRKRLKKKSQNNLILLSTSLKNLSIDSNESPKHNNNISNDTYEHCNNQVAITSNENIITESFINQITSEQCKTQVAISSNENIGTERTNYQNCDSDERNRPIIIENVQIIAPLTKQVVETLETSKSDDTSDSNKKLSDLKSNYNTRQLRRRKRKYKTGKNSSIIILDSPPNKKFARNNKTKKIQNHISNSIDINNDTIHSVSSSEFSNKTNSKTDKCIPSKLDNSSSSVQYDYASSFSQNNSSKQTTINNSSKNEKQNDESITQITQSINSSSESDKNAKKIVEKKSNIRTRRNLKQKSQILSMENEKTVEKRNRISKNRSPQLKSPKSLHLTPEAETINSKNSTSDCVNVIDHNLMENYSNQINTIQRNSYITARRNSKKKSKILLDENDKLNNESNKLLESKSPQINLENSSFSHLMNLEPEREIPSEILNISDKSTTNLSDINSININLNDSDTDLRATIDSKRITKYDSKQKSPMRSENKKEPLSEKSRILKPRISRLKSKKSISFIKLPLNEIGQNSINISSKDAGFVQRNSNVTSRRNSKQKLSSQTKLIQIDPNSTNSNSNVSGSVQRISNVTTRRNSKQKLSAENDQANQINISKVLNTSLNSQNSSKIMHIDPDLTNKISNDSALVQRISNVTTRRNSKQKLSPENDQSSKIIQIDPELTNNISNDSALVQRKSNVTTRRNSKQKLSSDNDQSKQIKISKVLNSSNDSQNSSIVDLEHSVIKDKENILDTNPLKSNILNKTQIKDSTKLNISTIHLSPEVSNYRNARQKSIEIRRKLARSKLPIVIGQQLKESIPENPPYTDLTETVNNSLNKPNKVTKLKNCKVPIKKNKNIKNNLIYKPTKDSIHCKHLENNTLKVSEQQERLSVKNHRKKLPIRKCKIPLLKTKINSKDFINPDNSYNHTISEIQLNKSVLNNDSKTITIVDSHNSTATDNSVMEISFDRDEFIKNINDHHIKKSLLQQTTHIKSIKQSSLSRHNSSNSSIGIGNIDDFNATSGPLINISNNITIRDSINQRKSYQRNSSSLNIKSKNITLKDTIRKKSAENSVNNKFNLIYDTLYEDLEEIQNNNNSQLLLLNQSTIINNDDKIQLRLSGGKWRRSLYAWRRNSISLMGKINSSQIINTELQLQQNLSGDINKKVEISNKENTECINSDTNDTNRNSLILSSQTFNKSNSIRKESNKNLKSLSLAQTSLKKDNEINFNVSQQRSSFLRKTLLLEPTDDEAPIIHKSCSLFNTFEKQSKLSSSSGNEAAETAASCGQEKQLLQLQNQQYLQQRTQTQQQQQLQNFIEKSSSLLQRQSKQKPPSTTSSAVYTEIVEETEEEEEELHIEDDDSEYNQSDGDVEYFNDRRILNKNINNKSTTTNSTNNKQKSDEIQNFLYVQRRATQSSNHQQRTSYQHQLSVPICGNRPSISILGQPSNRRRRTSFIEGFVDFNYHQEQRFLIDNFLKQSTATVVEEVEVGKGTKVEETKQLQKSNLHNKSSSRYIGTYENNENHIFLPTLDVSLRAQLSPRDIVLRRCQQTDPFEFSSIYSESVLHQCRKIGEGVYGEVFMNKNPNGEAIVLKIIPIEGQIEINGEVQKNFEQILPEIIIAEELSCLRNDKKSMTSGFVEVKNVHCVQGCYPDHLIDLWELYRDNCGTENDHPEIFPEDQLYIIFELANAGQDLEAFNFQNALQSYSAFLQVALSLAVAEEKFKFEHRDLHWGNILLQSTEQKEIYFKLNGKDYKIPTHGVKATIIDYTLSRMIFEGCCLYNDLSNDNELFSASGDYQFDVYRLMQKRLDNQWENYDPYTNILWLHYTIDKMISGARYRCSKTKKHRSAIQTIMKLRDELLDYNSASDYVESFDD